MICVTNGDGYVIEEVGGGIDRKARSTSQPRSVVADIYGHSCS